MNPVFAAALWMLGAILAFTSMAVAGRAVSFELDTFEIMLFRSLTGIVIVLCIGAYAGTLKQVRQDRLQMHFIRNLAHFIGQNLWFFAITVVPLAQVFALEFTGPLWVMVFTPLLLSERLTWQNILAGAIGFVGILVVTRPNPDTLSWGIGAAALAAVFFALTAVLTRKLTRDQSITCIMLWLTVMQAVFGLICAGYDGDIALPTAATLPWILLIGFAGLTAHFCLTKALGLAPATVVMPIDFARLPVIAIIGLLVYSEPLEWAVMLGAILIFLANYLNVWSAAKRA